MDTETKIDKWFTGKLGFLIQIVSIAVALTLSYVAIKMDIADTNNKITLTNKDIATISNNHLTHIQADIIELKEVYKEMDVKLQELIILVKTKQ